MKTVFIFIGWLVLSFDLSAGTCNNATVATSAGYTFTLTNTGGSNGQNTSFVYGGRMVFNGAAAGTMTVVGFEYAGAGVRTINLSGKYNLVAPTCIMTATFVLPAVSSLTLEKTITVTAYMDRLDVVPAINVAYHANAIFKTSSGVSGVGVFDRVIGKF